MMTSPGRNSLAWKTSTKAPSEPPDRLGQAVVVVHLVVDLRRNPDPEPARKHAERHLDARLFGQPEPERVGGLLAGREAVRQADQRHGAGQIRGRRSLGAPATGDARGRFQRELMVVAPHRGIAEALAE